MIFGESIRQFVGGVAGASKRAPFRGCAIACGGGVVSDEPAQKRRYGRFLRFWCLRTSPSVSPFQLPAAIITPAGEGVERARGVKEERGGEITFCFNVSR